MVVSGINAGPNLGDDVIYSGTVAAAMEGRHLDCLRWRCRWMATSITIQPRR